MISPEVLRRYSFFAGLGDEVLKEIAMLAEERLAPAGTRLFNEGEPSTHFCIIRSGEVHIQYLMGNDELRTVDTMIDGDILIWSALLEPYTTTAIGTTTEETRILAIAAAPLRELCDRNPLLGYRVMTQVAKLLAHRLENARIQLAAV